MSYNEDYLASIDNKLEHLAITVENIEVTDITLIITVCLPGNKINKLRLKFQTVQRVQTKQGKNQNFSLRLENVEKKQEEVLKLLTALRSELAGISSGMARRDSLMLGSSVVSGLAIRRDSLITTGLTTGDPAVRRDSLILGSEYGRNATIPVMEVEPWEPTPAVQQVGVQKITPG